jgi:argininosuccinate synthase
MIITGAVYEGRYLLGTSIARPILARAQVEVARQVGADALAHGCTGKGNDQVRFESAYAALAPDLEVIAPWRLWDLRSRDDLLAYLAERSIPTTASAAKIYSRDANLWHVSHEGGGLEDPWKPPPADVWIRTTDPAKAPAQPADVCIEFERGRPRALDGQPMQPEALVAKLNTVAGRHGVGRVDIVENRLVGMKSRGCYETPGGTVIVEALRGLEQLVLDRRSLHFREHLGLTFAELVYDGQWFTPLREAISACAESLAQRLDGEVVVRLHRGTATAVQRRSPKSLYAEDYATFGADQVYDQADAGGFIRLFSLPSRIAAITAAAREEKVLQP